MAEIIQSVDRALEILVYLEREGRETSLTKIATDLNMYKSTIFRTLATLETRGFVRKNPETDRYWLGSRLFSLGRCVEGHMGLQEAIRPFTRKLYDAYLETVNVSVLERNQGHTYRSMVILKEEAGRQLLSVNLPVGKSVECHATSGGKCLLAFGRDIDLSIYDREPPHAYTSHTIVSAAALRAELKEVRERGYALDQEEMEEGLSCIGAPILGEDGVAIAAISLSGPTGRMLSGDLEERVEAVKRAAREISTMH